MDPTRIVVKTDQCLEALARANRVRQVRAQLKRRIASGEVSATEAILFPRWETEAMSVGEVLTSQRQWGDRRCRRLLTAVQLQETKTIGSMTERQRLDLTARLNHAHDQEYAQPERPLRGKASYGPLRSNAGGL
jgi:hypothetical protein